MPPRDLSTEDLEAEKQVWRDAVAAIPNRRHEVREVVAQGNVEMARIVVTGTLHRDFADVDSLDDQRVADWWHRTVWPRSATYEGASHRRV